MAEKSRPDDCEVCQHLTRKMAKAVLKSNLSRQTDIRVLRRRHEPDCPDQVRENA
ncbi:hypothetical protein [Streptomyces luteolus]|uniref:Transposase n=1 Tax=Streptomyces luteolus TaxID=3043615 RepID=A0ABT6SV68_9ACTN|nr:hypothetical protein [Streptomyces sp. B-S-A12]MDI3419496.1 hypothetical protein [Streptomyces sp. B-S-A12]